jgi:hypothetical protein
LPNSGCDNISPAFWFNADRYTQAIEQKRRLEEALNTRKRSSRLAVRENEKEAARLAAQKKAEENAQNARAKRLEARVQREQEERERREKDREERRAAREARVAQRGVSMPEYVSCLHSTWSLSLTCCLARTGMTTNQLLKRSLLSPLPLKQTAKAKLRPRPDEAELGRVGKALPRVKIGSWTVRFAAGTARIL